MRRAGGTGNGIQAEADHAEDGWSYREVKGPHWGNRSLRSQLGPNCCLGGGDMWSYARFDVCVVCVHACMCAHMPVCAYSHLATCLPSSNA